MSLYPEYGNAAKGAEITDGAVHHGQMELRHCHCFALGAGERSSWEERGNVKEVRHSQTSAHIRRCSTPAPHHWERVCLADSVPCRQSSSRVEFCLFGPAPWSWRTPWPSCDSSDTRPVFCSSATRHATRSEGFTAAEFTGERGHLAKCNVGRIDVTDLLVGADARRAAKVKLRSIKRESLTGAGVAVAVEATAFAAVHGELPLVPPCDETSVAAEFVQATLMGDLVFDRLWGHKKQKTHKTSITIENCRLVLCSVLPC